MSCAALGVPHNKQQIENGNRQAMWSIQLARIFPPVGLSRPHLFTQLVDTHLATSNQFYVRSFMAKRTDIKIDLRKLFYLPESLLSK